MTPEQPATGILKQGDYGDAKFYYVQCDCSNPDCAHTLEVEADDCIIQVNIYHKQHTRWWKSNRWKQIWQILTKGYAEMETTLVLTEQSALNYADVLISAVKDVKDFRDQRMEKTREK